MTADKVLLSTLTSEGNNLFDTNSVSTSLSDYVQDGKLTLLIEPSDIQKNPNFAYLTEDYKTFDPTTFDPSKLPAQFVIDNNAYQAFLGAVSSPKDLRPELILDGTNAPIPEPSSVILGLMGLSGVLGFRKNRKKD